MSDLIICIRHAEKPSNAEHEAKPVAPDDPDGPGFDVHGRENRHALTIRGWQRAGALAASNLCGLLDPNNTAAPAFLVPQYLDEDVPCDETTTHRPYLTVVQLARKMTTWPTPICAADNHEQLYEHVNGCDGTAVVCWEHKELSKLAKCLLTTGEIVDLAWDHDDFALIWEFSRTNPNEPYEFRPIRQALLGTDSSRSADTANGHKH